MIHALFHEFWCICAVGSINGVAALTRFPYKKMYEGFTWKNNYWQLLDEIEQNTAGDLSVAEQINYLPKTKAEANKTHLDGTTHEQTAGHVVGSELSANGKEEKNVSNDNSCHWGRVWSQISLCLERHTNEAKGSTQSRIDTIASFACQTADNCDKSCKAVFHRSQWSKQWRIQTLG